MYSYLLHNTILGVKILHILHFYLYIPTFFCLISHFVSIIVGGLIIMIVVMIIIICNDDNFNNDNNNDNNNL